MDTPMKPNHRAIPIFVENGWHPKGHAVNSLASMSPNDRKAIKICAKLMRVSEEGYNPIENDEQAQALAERFRLTIVYPHESTIQKLRPAHEVLDVHRDGVKITPGFSNFTVNMALVYGLCYSHDPKWDGYDPTLKDRPNRPMRRRRTT